MIKRVTIVSIVVLGLTACGGYSEEQGKAADQFCECMDAELPEGDDMAQDILWMECEAQLMEDHGGEVMADEGFSSALEEKCASVAALIQESE